MLRQKSDGVSLVEILEEAVVLWLFSLYFALFYKKKKQESCEMRNMRMNVIDNCHASMDCSFSCPPRRS